MSLTTELDAVNAMLDAIGAAPVSSLDDPSVDTIRAKQRLAKVSREVQNEGWHFNKDHDYALARTPQGEYPMPLNTLRVDVSAKHPDLDVSWRGGKLWDKLRHTFVFDRDLTFDIVWLLPFEDLPEAARSYITLRAARQFQEKAVGSRELSRFDIQDEARARAALERAEVSTGDYNILSGSWSVLRVLNRDPGSFKP